MRLRELTSGLPDARLEGLTDPEIESLTCDSRAVAPGALFAALPGTRADGRAYAEEAVRRGARAVLLESDLPALEVPRVVVGNARDALSRVAAAFFGHPARSLRLTGITGTNGKTTVAFLLSHILREAGCRTGMLGTIVYDTGRSSRPAPLTTPDAVEFSRLLAEMVEGGCQHAVVEVSSHALAQRRTSGHPFAAAAFTNLTRDHLDYHGDMETYLCAKKQLFDDLDPSASAIVNADDSSGKALVSDCRAPIQWYGLDDGDGLRGRIGACDLDGSSVALDLDGLRADLRLPLVGRHNVMNALAALGAATRLGVDLADAADALSRFPGVPGRLERFAGGGVTAFVDYAHTDDALRSVLRVLRPLTPGRLLVVFGCGGDRDRGKRPLMAAAAEEEADVVFLTSDNPRTEPPSVILADVLEGFRDRQSVQVMPERREAIEVALGVARPGDVVLVAGKGHEDYQIVGERRLAFDDRAVVRDALARRETQ